MTFPPIQLAVMSEYGVGKSHFAATFPKPILVLHLDPFGKAQPYFDRGRLEPETYEGEFGQVVRRVLSRKSDSTIIQLEFFYDAEPTRPTAFDTLFGRFPSLADEVREGRWRTVVVDTFSTLDLYARYRRTYGPLKSDRPNVFSTEDVEQMLTRLGSLSTHANVVINCHIDENPSSMDPDRVETVQTKQGLVRLMGGGQMVATPKGPGRLRKGLGAMFVSELYYLRCDRDKDGNLIRWLQTQPDGRYACATRINAPNPCEPRYAALWTNWIAKQAAVETKP